MMKISYLRCKLKVRFDNWIVSRVLLSCLQIWTVFKPVATLCAALHTFLLIFKFDCILISKILESPPIRVDCRQSTSQSVGWIGRNTFEYIKCHLHNFFFHCFRTSRCSLINKKIAVVLNINASLANNLQKNFTRSGKWFMCIKNNTEPWDTSETSGFAMRLWLYSCPSCFQTLRNLQPKMQILSLNRLFILQWLTKSKVLAKSDISESIVCMFVIVQTKKVTICFLHLL